MSKTFFGSLEEALSNGTVLVVIGQKGKRSLIGVVSAATMPSGIRSKEEKAGNLGTSRDRRGHATVFLLQKVDVEDYDSDSVPKSICDAEL